MARTETEIKAEASTATIGGGERKQGMRGRALLIGAVGAAATAFLVTWAEMVLQTIKIGYLQFPPAALGMLLLIVALGRGVGKVAKRWELTSSDLLVIYCMCLVGAMTSSHGLVEKMVPALVYAKYGANNTNGWHDLYDRILTHRLVAYDPADGNTQAVADDYYKKMHPGGTLPWDLWGHARSELGPAGVSDLVRVPLPDRYSAAAVGG